MKESLKITLIKPNPLILPVRKPRPEGRLLTCKTSYSFELSNHIFPFEDVFFCCFPSAQFCDMNCNFKVVKCILNGIFDSCKVISRVDWIALVWCFLERESLGSSFGLFASENVVCLEICSFCDSS